MFIMHTESLILTGAFYILINPAIKCVVTSNFGGPKLLELIVRKGNL